MPWTSPTAAPATPVWAVIQGNTVRVDLISFSELGTNYHYFASVLSSNVKVLFFFFFFFFVLHPQHIEVPRLGVEPDLQLPAYATASQDPSPVCDLHHSSRQGQILNPLSLARDRTHNLMVPSEPEQNSPILGFSF